MPRAAALLACAFGAGLILAGLYQSRLGRQSRGFTRARGRVIVSEVEEIPGPSEEGGPRFRPVIRYRYEARGRTYESEQLALASSAGGASSEAREARGWVERLPAGSEVDVWFDPRDPKHAVLIRGVPRAQVIATLATGIALVGWGMFALARSAPTR